MPFLNHFGLTARPFSLTPNSALYYPSESHQEALRSVGFALDRGEGIIKVTGEVGTGKTLLCRMLVAELVDKAAVAYVINPQNDSDWVIGAVCREFGLDPDRESDPFHALNVFLLERFRADGRAVLVVDEAQALGPVGLETVRRLSNLETDKSKLLQIVLFGQPELDRLLQGHGLRQLNQRIVFSFTIDPLTTQTTVDYIRYRLLRSSADEVRADKLFQAKALRAIARASKGIPRIINIIADKSLLAAYGRGADQVTPAHVREAVADSPAVMTSRPPGPAERWGRAALDTVAHWSGGARMKPEAGTATSQAGAGTTEAPAEAGHDPTIAEESQNWLYRCERSGLARSTIERRKQHVERHIVPSLGEAKLGRLTADDVRDFAGKIAATHSPAVARGALSSLKALIAAARRRGAVDRNVAREVNIAAPARPAKPVVVPPKNELRAMVAAASGCWRPLIIAAVLTGMRAAELRGLSWDDVDFDAGVIHVRRRADGRNGLGPPKPRAGVRDIPMAPMVTDTLRVWRSACPGGRLNLVFPDDRGGVRGLAAIERRGFGPLQKACRLVDGGGKPKYRFDALRHGAASLFIEQGWSARKLQTVLGQSSVAAIRREYGHLFPGPEADVAAMAEIEARLMG
ncbi:MAG: AAA family ATPase [Proteobacteria bacterium]|nr:AAA family ATPase [Pseudomonadota bacterium]